MLHRLDLAFHHLELGVVLLDLGEDLFFRNPARQVGVRVQVDSFLEGFLFLDDGKE